MATIKTTTHGIAAAKSCQQNITEYRSKRDKCCCCKCYSSIEGDNNKTVAVISSKNLNQENTTTKQNQIKFCFCCSATLSESSSTLSESFDRRNSLFDNTDHFFSFNTSNISTSTAYSESEISFKKKNQIGVVPNYIRRKLKNYRKPSTILEETTMNFGSGNNVQNRRNFANGTTDINRNGIVAKNGQIMTSSGEKREHLYKILVIGELGTGKTSFIKRYVHQFFSQNYRATIGVDFALKVLHWDPNTIVRLQLWDIAGQERFGNMTRVYYKEAVGAFIVFDITRSGTFDCVSKWKEDLDSKVQLPDGSPIPCILLANKCDQDKQGIVTSTEKMDEYVRENGFAGWYETSAKENINIDESARALVNKILLNDKLISAADLADSEKFNLNNTSTAQSTAQTIKNKCSC